MAAAAAAVIEAARRCSAVAWLTRARLLATAATSYGL
jgi:hypothetical protein